MEIIQEKIVKKDWANQLRNMPGGDFAGYEDKKHYASMRTAATRLQQNNNWKFHFDNKGDKLKVTKEILPEKKD